MRERSKVPKLRFPGFADEWEEKKLGEIATNRSEKYNPKASDSFVKCIALEHIESGTGRLLGFTDGSRSESTKNVFRKGDVLFGKLRSYLRKHCRPDFDGVCSSEIWVLSGKGISNGFLCHLVQTDRFLDLAGQSSGTKMPRADWNVVENGQFFIPSLAEQAKIASFLSKLDERIVTQTDLVGRLESLMAGIGERLFSREARFPGFDGEWERKKLGEVLDFKTTNSLSRSHLNYEKGCVKNIHYGDIHTKFQTLFDISKETVPFINEWIDVDRISDENYCKEGDIVFADASEDLNDTGKNIEIVNLNGERLLSGLHTLLARPKKGFFHLGFGGYLFKSSKIRAQIEKESQGTKVFSINVGRISTIDLAFPSLAEQAKIANFLSSIDEKIRMEKDILAGYQAQKRYLLRNMFI